MEGAAPLRILGATAYPESAASARVRLAQFVPFLGSHNIDLEFAPALQPAEYATLSSSAASYRKFGILARSAARAAGPRSDQRLLLIHRLRLLNPVPFVDPPRHLDAYDFDDALFEGSAAAVNQRFQWAKQEAHRALACIRRARVVLAGNAYLASRASEHNRRVEVVPSCVDPDVQPLHRHGDSEAVTIGWIGSHTTVAYLKPILPAIDRINRDRLRARLIVVGGDLGYTAPWLEQRPWSLDRQAADLASFDIGIMPLPDNEWARGKCGYKVLQYFSAGVPAVASPVGITRDLVGGGRGYLAKSPAEWEDALRRLVSDVAERAERGAAARLYVEQSYSYQQWARTLAEILWSLA